MGRRNQIDLTGLAGRLLYHIRLIQLAELLNLTLVEYIFTMSAKLVLRNKEYEVRAGMTLLDALKKTNIIPESVIATRDGEMVTEDEILQKDDVIKLIAVISGGSR